MNNQRRWLSAYHYIDAFAGSGTAKAKDEERYVEGSPLRALKCEPPFSQYWFIEVAQKRVQHLEELKAQFPQHHIKVFQGDCNKILREKIIPSITYKSRQRGLVFLDPYGLQVQWDSVEALAKEKAFDVFVNFPLMAVTRLLKRDEPPKGKILKSLNLVMGSEQWKDQIYYTSPQRTLFDETPIIRDTMRAEWLARVYADQLGKVFPFVSKPVIMMNSKNAPLYALFLASHKRNAVKIVNDIFSRYERLRELRR